MSTGSALPLPGPRISRRRLLFSAGGIGTSAAGLALLSSACGLVLPSQLPAKVPRIGYLSPCPREALALNVNAFLDGLRDLGYIQGQTVALEWRFTPQGTDAEFPEMADELVRLPVDVIVAAGSTPAALAAKRATNTIPIVAVVAWPVESGLVTSLARPGTNLTALSAGPLEIKSKQLDLLQDTVPSLTRVAALVDATNPVYDVAGWDEVRTAAEHAGVHPARIDLRTAEDLEAAFEAAALSRADAVIDVQNPLLLPVPERVAALALQHRLPAMFAHRNYVASGVLMSYNANAAAIHRRAATYVDKILKGAKPADLPVEQPTTFDLVVNAKTLESLGLTIPPTVLPLVTE